MRLLRGPGYSALSCDDTFRYCKRFPHDDEPNEWMTNLPEPVAVNGRDHACFSWWRMSRRLLGLHLKKGGRVIDDTLIHPIAESLGGELRAASETKLVAASS